MPEPVTTNTRPSAYSLVSPLLRNWYNFNAP
jgi:hypothetical protein